MSETVALAIIAAIPPTVASLGALIVAMRQGRRQQRHNVKSEAMATEIADKVDGAASASVTKIEGLQTKVDALHATISDQNQTAALLAQSVAMSNQEKP